MSRLEHYAGQDEIGLRYNSHRTKREEYRKRKANAVCNTCSLQTKLELLLN